MVLRKCDLVTHPCDADCNVYKVLTNYAKDRTNNQFTYNKQNNTRFSFLLFKSHGTAEGMNRVERRFVSTSVAHRTLITCIRFSVRMVYSVSLHFVIIRTYMNQILKVRSHEEISDVYV